MSRPTRQLTSKTFSPTFDLHLNRLLSAPCILLILIYGLDCLAILYTVVRTASFFDALSSGPRPYVPVPYRSCPGARYECQPCCYWRTPEVRLQVKSHCLSRPWHFFPYPTLLERNKNTAHGCFSPRVETVLSCPWCVPQRKTRTPRDWLLSTSWTPFLERVRSSTATPSATRPEDWLPLSFR